MTIHESYIVLLVGLAMMMAVYIVSAAERRRASKHASRLENTYAALEVHYDAMEKFLGDPAAPDLLKEVLVDLSDFVSDRRAAIALAEHICDVDHGPSQPGDGSVSGLLTELNKHRADLVEQFHLAMTKGVVALLLRWPETAATFEKFMAQSGSVRDSALAGAVRSTKRGWIARDDTHHDGADQLAPA